MRPPLELLAELRSRDLFDQAERIAARYHVALSDVCTPARGSDLVAARHAIWIDQIDELGTQSAVARLWGVDHTSVMGAVDGDGREIVRVVLDDYRDHRFLWASGAFLIVDRLSGRRFDFASYAIARAAWVALLEQAGQTTFRTESAAPPHPPPSPPSDAPLMFDGGAA